MAYNPIRRKRRPFRRRFTEIGTPKYENGDKIGHFEIIRYEGHSRVNKRTAQYMAKAQHWYRCLCTCGTEEHRSQQELIDTRRQQKCFICRPISPKKKEEACLPLP